MFWNTVVDTSKYSKSYPLVTAVMFKRGQKAKELGVGDEVTYILELEQWKIGEIVSNDCDKYVCQADIMHCHEDSPSRH